MRAFISKNRAAVVYVSLALITFLAFGNVIRCGFINLDDPDYITENSHVQAGLTPEALRWAFTTFHAANWHPLTWISLMADVQFFGLDPHLSHLVNLLFHIANVLLLFYALLLMTRTLWRSAFVAALFAIHPLHVESVAWVAERKDVLSTLFWMLTMIAYYYYVQRPGVRRYLPVFLLFALGLMAKPMLVTLPLVLLLLDYWPFGRFRTASIRRLLLEKIPFLALSAVSSAVTYIAHLQGGTVESFKAYPLCLRIENALTSYVIYILKTLWPGRLAFFYPYPRQWQFWQIAAVIMILSAVTTAVVCFVKRFPYLMAGWLWYLVTLLPVIGLVQTGEQARADRYTYIPSIGLFIMAAWGIPELLKKWRYHKNVLAASAALTLASYSIVASLQTDYWRDSFTLYDHTIEVTNNNNIAYENRGAVYYALGNYVHAIADFDRAIEIAPGFPTPYNNRGVVYEALGNHMRAIADFDRAIEIDPGLAEAYSNRGISYAALGNYKQAIVNYDTAININPRYSDAYFYRALSFIRLGDQQCAYSDVVTAARLGFKAAQDFLRSKGISW